MHTENGGEESKFKIPLARGNKTRNSRSDARMGILIITPTKTKCPEIEESVGKLRLSCRRCSTNLSICYVAKITQRHA